MSQSPDVSRTGSPAIHVALLAALRDGVRGREVLLTRRSADAHLGGYWELPGGKVERDGQGRPEPSRHAASREAAEELGLRIESNRLEACGTTSHAYPDRTIRFDLFLVQLGEAEVTDLERRSVVHTWVPIHQLDDWKLPPANAAVNRLLLKRLG